MTVVVAARDAKFRAQLLELLGGAGHRVVEAGSAAAALQSARGARPHLLVVACGGDGEVPAFLRGLRAEPATRLLPVLCVDPQAGATDAVALLDAGADDAITRPFQPPIFLARVRNLLRRAVVVGAAPEDEVTSLAAAGIEMRLLARQVFAAGRAVELTRLEFDLLAQFLRYPDRAFKREELLAAVWNYPGGVETRTLDKHVESLRRKVPACASLIQTVHGVGYRLAAASVAKA